ncbi:hypothetical protein T492DRAFT_1142632 [Pavlovales sp. CCMP2436]|nr:hypothetical protein T492DRAFT_1142632 [Pavlovales sp. CCMP2436]
MTERTSRLSPTPPHSPWLRPSHLTPPPPGDGEEHALLLCNFLLHRKEEAYVVEGTAGVLYNAVSGRSYAADDAQCPLAAVGMLFNGSNVWANVQAADAPGVLSWSLAEPASWRRLFGEGAVQEQVGSWTHSVQLATPAYQRAAEEDKNDLEREIERAVRLHVEERRGTRPTDWNNHVRRTLKQILVRLEADARDGVSSKPDELKAELADVLQTNFVVGFPLNLTWTDIKQVIDALDATDIHNNAGKELKFALAVHVVGYPNSVYSIWVYVAALTSSR